MLEGIEGKEVEVVFGAFDAVDGKVVGISDEWIRLEKKNRTVFVHIEKVVRIHCRKDRSADQR